MKDVMITVTGNPNVAIAPSRMAKIQSELYDMCEKLEISPIKCKIENFYIDHALDK